jgi:hypothetical protein
MEKMFILGRHIDILLCKMLCSEINYNHFEIYIQHLRDKKLHLAINILYDISSLGYSVVDIYDYLFTFIKDTAHLNENEKYLLIPLFCDYITIFHSVHEDSIELALFTNKFLLTLHSLNNGNQLHH